MQQPRNPRWPCVQVFVLSLRSGAVGINLTAASHVFMLEPVMNPALDEQAVGRAWRMGQKRAVVVRRLYMQGTIEESIIKMVKTRRDATSEAAAPCYAPRAKKSVVAPTNAGAVTSDKANLKFDELKLLFAPPVKP